MTDDSKPAGPWDRHQIETDDPATSGPQPATDPAATDGEEGADRPDWNLGSMAPERADGSGGPHTEPVDPDEGTGPSGGGVNPGGGERWAERDKD